MTKILSINNLQKIYYSKTDEVMAIKDLSFDLNAKEFVSIVGPSGCGKSTLLNILMGMDKPTKGNITFHDKKVKLGYMLQSDSLLSWRNVLNNIYLGLEIKKEKTKENLDYVNHLLNTYGLFAFKDKYPSELSGGMKEKQIY